MITKLSLLINQISNTRFFLGSFLVTTFLMVVVFPWLRSSAPGVEEELAMLDLRFKYSPEEAYLAIDSFGESGRKVYIISSLTADSLFPVSYSLLFSISLTLLYQRAFPTENLIQRFHLFPFGILVFDFLENFSVVIMMLAYPLRLSWLARLASIFTMSKWSALASTIVLVLVGLVGLMVVKNRKAP
jgi:hypothetical protein